MEAVANVIESRLVFTEQRICLVGGTFARLSLCNGTQETAIVYIEGCARVGTRSVSANGMSTSCPRKLVSHGR